MAFGKKPTYIVEGEYTTGAQEQLYIENNGMIATFDGAQGITVWGSLQCPYYIHKALMALCNLPAEKVRVVQMETGGAFGGKEEYPSMIAAHAALLAIKSGKPGEDYLRPHGRHGGDHEAASLAHAPKDGGQQGRQDSRRRDRVHD
jgi:xanthine dehydrogenase molybdopterin-binding subunit B